MHKHAIGALNLLKRTTPGMELKCLDGAHALTIPLRELNFDYDRVRDSNPPWCTSVPANDTNMDRAQLSSLGSSYDANGVVLEPEVLPGVPRRPL